MDLSQIKKGLFSVKQPTEKKEEITPTETTGKEKITYTDYGFLQASRLGGTTPGLRTCLHKIYNDFKQEIKDDVAEQDKLKKPYKVKIEDYKGDNERLEKKIEKVKSDYLARAIKKIETLKEELSHIKKNPQEVTGDDAGKASFFIGGIILLFLTVYLFIFYSSASYSAFFKEFSLNEIGVANSIFDAQALSKAFKDGVTELALILTIPFVFLGLGYLIHKFQEQKDYKKYIKIAMLIFITFIFDSILAYEITEKIYNIKKENSFNDIPDYTVSMAFQSVNFWLIIFAGFIVYVIWGFVFDFVMESYAKMDKVKVAIQEKEKQIKDAEAEQKDLEVQLDKMTHTIDENNKEINKLNKILESSIIPREFEHDIFSFLTGWMAWMKQSGKAHNDLDEADKLTHEFVKVTLYSLETINTN
jgi:F0F1-type ATP synthase membrane subunit b/b'